MTQAWLRIWICKQWSKMGEHPWHYGVYSVFLLSISWNMFSPLLNKQNKYPLLSVSTLPCSVWGLDDGRCFVKTFFQRGLKILLYLKRISSSGRRRRRRNGHKLCSITCRASSKTREARQQHPVVPVHAGPSGHSSGPVWRSKRLR